MKILKLPEKPTNVWSLEIECSSRFKGCGSRLLIESFDVFTGTSINKGSRGEILSNPIDYKGFICPVCGVENILTAEQPPVGTALMSRDQVLMNYMTNLLQKSWARDI